MQPCLDAFCHYDTTAGKTPQPFLKRQPKPGSRRCSSHMSEPSRSARGPNFETQAICAQLWQRRCITRKENGQTARAGKTNGHSFHNLLALPTDPPQEKSMPPNGVRYPRVGGRRQHHFDGTNFEPRKLPENAASPTRRVHAVLGRMA